MSSFLSILIGCCINFVFMRHFANDKIHNKLTRVVGGWVCSHHLIEGLDSTVDHLTCTLTVTGLL